MRKIYTALLGVFLVLLSLSSVSAETFKIDEVDIIELDIIELVFTRELDASLGAIQEFILEEQSSLNEIEILLSEVNPDNATRLTLMLGEFLEEETDYTITVLDIKDSGGNTIEAGIDSIFTFNTGRMTIGNNNQEPESSDDSLFEDDMLEEEDVLIEDDLMNNEEDELDVELNAAAELEMNENNGIAGTTTNGEGVGTGVLTHAENNDTLPDTGPEIILLLIITFLLAGGYMYTRSIRV